MKNKTRLKLVTIHPHELAKALKRKLGEDRAIRVASYTLKQLKSIQTGDVNPDLFDMRDIRRDEDIWQQVSSILKRG